ncbi:MAG: sulfatase [Opitutales bacterium]|nr:sulfatase [Opitutales bacterium]
MQKSCVLVFLWFSFFCLSSASTKPNVLFILVDDLGARDLSNEGSTFYETPNIDRIAKEGMKFTRGYATCQVCSPSRASILTGKYPTNHGITEYIGGPVGVHHRKRGRYDSHLPPEYERNLKASEITLAEAMQDAGYKTFFAGKWHLGGKGSWPTDHGFDINQGGWDVGGPRGGFFSPYTNPNLNSGPKGESLTLRLGQETAKFIEKHKDQPFLAYLSFYTVHAPIQTTQALWKKYRDKAEKTGLIQNKERFLFDRRLNVRQAQDCPVYAGMIESLDKSIGIVLQKLKELGLGKDTIICFTSDNGGVSSGDAYATSNLPLRGGKGRQWEGGIREPFYIKAPGVIKDGSTSSTPVSGIDWYPTLLELCNITSPQERAIDGVSLVPLLQGEKIKARPLFWHYPHYGNQGGEPSSIIMEGNWKLIHYHEDGRDELYNLLEDVGEQNELSSSESTRAKQMRVRLDQWLGQTNAIFPTKDPAFDASKRSVRWKQIKTQQKAGLEKQHSRFLSPNYKPNKHWWGSSVD